jgi:hypothetical protein
VLNKYTYITVSEQSGELWKVGVKKAVLDFSGGVVAGALASVATRTIVKMLDSTAGKRQVEQR